MHLRMVSGLDCIKISDLQLLAAAGQLIWTEHLSLRLRERNIKRADIIACIQNGEIIEQYPDAYPHPACLVMAIIKDDEPIHVVAGINDNNLFIITAYYPNPDRWENDYKTRKAGK